VKYCGAVTFGHAGPYAWQGAVSKAERIGGALFDDRATVTNRFGAFYVLVFTWLGEKYG